MIDLLRISRIGPLIKTSIGGPVRLVQDTVKVFTLFSITHISISSIPLSAQYLVLQQTLGLLFLRSGRRRRKQ